MAPLVRLGFNQHNSLMIIICCFSEKQTSSFGKVGVQFLEVLGALVVLSHQTPGLYERGAACFNKERDRVSTENNLSEVNVTVKRMYPATLRWVTITVVNRSRPALNQADLSSQNCLSVAVIFEQ